ncbi:hypothetical protein [Bradyrhizobium sp. UFLA05-112]
MWNAKFRIEAARMRRIRSARIVDGAQIRPPSAWDRWQNRLVRIRSLLIGGWDGNASTSLNGWISFGLHYRALLPRFSVALVLFLLLAEFDWHHSWHYPPLNRFLAALDPLPHLAEAFALLALAAYASLLSLRLVIDIVEFGRLGRIVAAMALPISVMGVATYLLFFNDQGRELGLGLMDKKIGQFAMLFLVLIYWAVSAWLSARIGLNRAFPEPEHHQVLLFWGPRLVGVIAHFLAACSLSFAALQATNFTHTVANIALAVTAPIAIVLAVSFVWFLEHALLPHRGNAEQRARARSNMQMAAFFEVMLLMALGFALWREIIPAGLFWAILAISLSAIGFLGVISWLRRRPPLGSRAVQEHRQRDTIAEARNSWICGLGLTAIMVGGTLAIWISPMWVGGHFGSLVIAFFAFGSFLSGANLLDLIADSLARDCRRRGFTAIHRQTVWCVFVGLLVAPAILMSATRTYHPVRLCGQCKPAPQSPGMSAIARYDQRPTVTEAVEAWYQKAAPIYHSLHPGEPVPLFIIATAGGGIRAAYWTATVLEKLEAELDDAAIEAAIAAAGQPDNDGLMRPLLFAISGVSGGSVGAAAYAAAVHDHLEKKPKVAPTNGTTVGPKVEPTTYLEGDLLAPGLASLAFIDIPSNFLPDFGQIDRGEALERGFEQQAPDSGMLSNSFTSFFPEIRLSPDSWKWRPALLLNATHQETGRRIITSHLKIDQDTFVDSYDALKMLASDVRLSTAAHNSARFTYISPAGDLIDPDNKPHGFVIDGGYFENYGAQTAVELARAAIKAKGNAIRPVILQISSDPTMVVGKTLVRQCTDHRGEALESYQANRHWWDLSLFNELSAQMIGIMSVREAHGFTAVTGLAHLCCEDQSKPELDIGDATSLKSATLKPLFFHMAMCAQEQSFPLGWVLSDQTRERLKGSDRLKGLLTKCDNDDQLSKLVRALGKPVSLPSKVATVGP